MNAESNQYIALFFVVIYLFLCIGIGIWSYYKTKSTSDFFAAGRSLGPVLIGLAIFSSTLSGFGFVGGPGLVYASGTSSIWMVSICALGFSLTFFTIAKPIRIIAELRDCISLPDVVYARYNSNPTRLLLSLTIILGVMGYLATQILAMSVVLFSLIKGIEIFSFITLFQCIIFSTIMLIFYCTTGGIIASIYTDLIQGTIMIIGGILICITAISVYDGGLSEASSVLFKDHSESIMPFGTSGILVCLAWFFVFGIGYAGQPHVVTKMMMNRDIRDNKIILPLSIFGFTFAALLWISIGIIMRSTVVDGSIDPLISPDQAAPVFLNIYTNPYIAGIVYAGLFAAIMSTADAFINIGVAAITHDIPKSIKGSPLNNDLFWARIGTISLCIIASIFATYSYYFNDRLIALLGAFGWGTFAAAIVPVLVIGLNWKSATREAAAFAIFISLIINFSIEIFSISIPYNMPGSFLAMLTSITSFIGISLVTSNHIDQDINEALSI